MKKGLYENHMTSWYRLRMMFPVQTSKNTSRQKDVQKNMITNQTDTWQPANDTLLSKISLRNPLITAAYSGHDFRPQISDFSKSLIRVKSVELHIMGPLPMPFPPSIAWASLRDHEKHHDPLRRPGKKVICFLEGMALQGVPIDPPSRSSLF